MRDTAPFNFTTGDAGLYIFIYIYTVVYTVYIYNMKIYSAASPVVTLNGLYIHMSLSI